MRRQIRLLYSLENGDVLVEEKVQKRKMAGIAQAIASSMETAMAGVRLRPQWQRKSQLPLLRYWVLTLDDETSVSLRHVVWVMGTARKSNVG